jgi:hypothetical protein
VQSDEYAYQIEKQDGQYTQTENDFQIVPASRAVYFLFPVEVRPGGK